MATFIDERRRPLGLELLGGDAELSILESIKLKFTAKDRSSGQPDVRASLRKIDRVLTFLAELEGTAPQWYEFDNLEEGAWIHFEARLAYAGEELIFLMWTPAKFNKQSERWEQPDPVLILHGSIQHALDYRKKTESVINGIMGGSDKRSFLAAASVLFSHKEETIRNFRLDERPESIEEIMQETLNGLCGYLPDAVGMMAGFAQVRGTETVISPVDGQERRVIVASPLYVEEV